MPNYYNRNRAGNSESITSYFRDGWKCLPRRCYHLKCSDANSYTWNDGTSAAGSSITINPKFTGSQVFTITGTSADNCTAKTTLTVSVQACNGIAGNDVALFNIYPNPSQGNLTIDGMENGTVKVYNQTGQLVFEGKITSAANTLDLSHLTKGLYQVNLQQGSQTVVKKIVIE